MRVLADSHVVVWYLLKPARLPKPAYDTLLKADQGDGIAVSAMTLPDLWLTTRKTSSPPLSAESYARIRTVLADPLSSFQIVPVTSETTRCFEQVPHPDIRDPFDRFILAAALEHDLPLVTADRLMRNGGGVKTIWQDRSA